ncbi:MAG: hypothetical protein V4850_27015 [Myxococcota bacterium]
MSRILLALLLLGGCAARHPAPATQGTPASVQQRGQEAMATLKAWEDGGRKGLAVEAEMAGFVEAMRFLGLWLYRMDMATAHGSDILAPWAQKDERWAKVYLARPVPEDVAKQCCIDVSFPAWVDDTPMAWLTVKGGWSTDGRSGFQPNFVFTDPNGAVVDMAAGVPDTLDSFTVTMPEPAPLDASMARRVRVLRDVIAHAPALPWPSYNTVVFSSADFGQEDMLRVYLIPSTPDPDLRLVSGWVVYTVEPGTEDIGKPMFYGNGPITNKNVDLPAGATTTGMFVTSVLPTPTEAHVFASLMYDLPLLVSSDYGLWRVEKGEVWLLRVY